MKARLSQRLAEIASTAQEKGRPQHALRAYALLRRLEPQQWRWWGEACVAHRALGQWEEADRIVEEGLDKLGEVRELLMAYGDNAMDTQRWEEGLVRWARLRVAHPGEPYGWRRGLEVLLALGAALALGGCATPPGWLASSGPSAEQVTQVEQREPLPVAVVDVSDEVARRLQQGQVVESFAAAFGEAAAPEPTVGPGDVLEVSIWEAPPAALFGVAATEVRGGVGPARQTTLPEQVVGRDGMINVPFAGAVPVVGRTLAQIEREIARRLADKANQPQVLVRMVRNVTQTVTVVGEVAQPTRLPLSARGERLLDAVAAAGGTRQPVGKVTLQLARAGRVLAMPLERVIEDPRQNVPLHPGDVVTALFQPLSFTALGATGRNEEVAFEATGITLAQALGRVAGLRDAQADARGVFVFRFEEPGVLPPAAARPWPRTPEGRVPVVYRLDLKDPRSFLVAQRFPMRHRDVLYVANAPAAELQKFLGILSSALFSVNNLIDVGR